MRVQEAEYKCTPHFSDLIKMWKTFLFHFTLVLFCVGLSNQISTKYIQNTQKFVIVKTQNVNKIQGVSILFQGAVYFTIKKMLFLQLLYVGCSISVNM